MRGKRHRSARRRHPGGLCSQGGGAPRGRRPARIPKACFVISLVAGALGFTGIASGAGSLARILFGLFLLVAIVIVVIAFAVGQAVF